MSNILKANAYLLLHSAPLAVLVKNPLCFACLPASLKAIYRSCATDGVRGRYAKMAMGIKQRMMRKMMIFYLWAGVLRAVIGTL
jgi:hypothetical protein